MCKWIFFLKKNYHIITDNNLLCNKYYPHGQNNWAQNQAVGNNESIANMNHATIGQQLTGKIWKETTLIKCINISKL